MTVEEGGNCSGAWHGLNTAPHRKCCGGGEARVKCGRKAEYDDAGQHMVP